MRGVYKYEPLRPLKDLVDAIFCGFIGYGYALDFNWKYYLSCFAITIFIKLFLSYIEGKHF